MGRCHHRMAPALFYICEQGQGRGFQTFFGERKKKGAKICKFRKLVFNFVLLLIEGLPKSPLKEEHKSYGYIKDRPFGSP